MTAHDDKLAEMFKTQQSLTEWLDDINHDMAEELRVEDNNKRERLKVINRITGLPFDEPVQFAAEDLASPTEEFKKYLTEFGEQPCALRLIPIVDGKPKLRMRGFSVAKAYEWFKEQDINPADYRADFVPHETCTFSTTFVVVEQGIVGEIIEGGHHQLTQGFHEDGTPITFTYDFKNWELSEDNSEALVELKKIIAYLKIGSDEDRTKLAEELGATFSNDYLMGYFETTDSDDFGVWFKDYNQTLGEMYADTNLYHPKDTGIVSGQVGAPGVAVGLVRIVHPDELKTAVFDDADVLVCEVTTPEYVPLMSKVAAIVTDQGGILSHAAIVARELKTPCIVGTGSATKELKNGQRVKVDADDGVVLEA